MEVIVEQELKGQKAKRKSLARNPEVIAKIRERWNIEPRPTKMEIARELGFPSSSIQQQIF